jgi:hypothetical protein
VRRILGLSRVSQFAQGCHQTLSAFSAPRDKVSVMASRSPQLQYARVYESGDSIMLWCAYCGVKHFGDGLIRSYPASQADIEKVHSDRADHDEAYHRERWWTRRW